jgi:hypothetical protein
MIFNIPMFSSSVMLFSSSLLFLMTLTITTIATQQTWLDKLNNLKIQFGYSPKEPVVDKPTELKFTVQNLQTGEQIKNLSASAVVVNNAGGQLRTFKFTNITAPNGIFSVKYLFPDSGLYQVLTKIDSNDFTSLASFNVSVPFAPLGTVNVGNLNPIVIPAIAGIIAATVGIALIWRIKRR